MSYVTPPNLIKALAHTYGNIVASCVGDPYDYNNIVWESTPVTLVQLEADQIQTYKDLIISKIRLEADINRAGSTYAILSTRDQEQLRTYEEKYNEAVAYLANNTISTPIMSAEVSHTGETLATLAPLVVGQYEYAKNLIKGRYGNIEGIRRQHISIVSAYTSMLELQNYTGPTWS